MNRSTNRSTFGGTGVLLVIGAVVIGGIGGFVGVADAAASAATEPAASPQQSWNQTYGGENRDLASAVIETSDGGYLLAGETDSAGAGSSDVWVVKVDETGAEEWNRTYGGAGYDVASAVVETSDGYLLAGHTSSAGAGFWDAWLVKIDGTGAEEWNRTYGGERRDLASAVVETSDGGYLLAGQTSSAGDSSGDAWLVKVDGTGAEEWSRTYGGASSDTARSVVETDGGYLFAGETESAGAGSGDAWLVRVDEAGTEAWARTYGGEGRDRAAAVVETSDGGYLLAGGTTSFGAGSSDAWAVKVDGTGAEAWNETYGGERFDRATAAVETGDGYLLAGRTYGDGGSDAWAVKVDGAGAEAWNETYAGSGYDLASAVVETSDGGYLLAGQTSSGASGIDAWLVRLDPALAEVEVEVDVKPESDRSAIDPDSGGVIPVAIYDTTGVDPAAIDASTLEVGAPDESGAGAAPVHGGHLEDVDGDGDRDLLVHVRARATGLDADDTAVRVVGRLSDGTRLEGTDEVETVENEANHGVSRGWKALGAGSTGGIVELDTRRHRFVRIGSLVPITAR